MAGGKGPGICSNSGGQNTRHLASEQRTGASRSNDEAVNSCKEQLGDVRCLISAADEGKVSHCNMPITPYTQGVTTSYLPGESMQSRSKRHWRLS